MAIAGYPSFQYMIVVIEIHLKFPINEMKTIETGCVYKKCPASFKRFVFKKVRNFA